MKFKIILLLGILSLGIGCCYKSQYWVRSDGQKIFYEQFYGDFRDCCLQSEKMAPSYNPPKNPYFYEFTIRRVDPAYVGRDTMDLERCLEKLGYEMKWRKNVR